MRVEPDVTLSREIAFRDPGCIQTSPSDIHGTHQVEPTHLADCGGLNKALLDGEVQCGDNTAKSKTHKHACSCRSVTRCREPVPLGNYDGCNAEDTYNGEVDKSRLRRTIEGVVQPGHEGAHDQEGNARVVKLGEGSGHFLRVAVDCMKKPGEAEAEHSSQEEHPKHHFLLQRGHKIHVRPQQG